MLAFYLAWITFPGFAAGQTELFIQFFIVSIVF